MKKNYKKQTTQKINFFSLFHTTYETPISNIVGLSNFLKPNIKKWEKEKIEEFVEQIYVASKQASNLFESLLTWARYQTDKIAVEKQEIQIISFIKNLKNSINNLFLLKKKPLSILYTSNKKKNLQTKICLAQFYIIC